MYIEAVPNRNSPPAILLREGYREDGKVKKRTLANLSQWDPQLIEHFRVLLRGGVAVASAQELFAIERSLPHGHVAAVLGAARGIGIEAWFGAAPAPLQPLLLAMVVARVVSPASKLATHRMLHDDTATHSLGRVLGVGQVPPEQLYGALIGCTRRSPPSSSAWHASTWPATRWCSTTSPRPGSPGAAANWRRAVIRVMASATIRRSSSA